MSQPARTPRPKVWTRRFTLMAIGGAAVTGLMVALAFVVTTAMRDSDGPREQVLLWIAFVGFVGLCWAVSWGVSAVLASEFERQNPKPEAVVGR